MNLYELPTNSPKREIVIKFTPTWTVIFIFLKWTMIFIFYWFTPTQIFRMKTWSNFRIWFVAKHCASFHFWHQLVMEKEVKKWILVLTGLGTVRYRWLGSVSVQTFMMCMRYLKTTVNLWNRFKCTSQVTSLRRYDWNHGNKVL